MIGQDRAIKLLRRVVEASRADQTEALLLTEDSSLTRFTPSAVHQHVSETNQTLILRAVLGKKVAVATTNNLQGPSLNRLAGRVMSLAGAQRENEGFVSLPGPKPIPEIQTFFPSIDRLTPGRKVKTIQDLWSLTKALGARTLGAFSHGKVEMAVANSLGVEAYQAYSDLFIHVIAENGKNSGYASFVSRDADQLNIEQLSREAAGRISDQEPTLTEPGEYEVVLSPYAVSELLSFLGYLGFHARAVQEGRSFFCGAFGQRLADERVTIYDDGLEPEGLQVPFDFEGLPKRKVIFLDRGVAKEVTYDSFTAGREERESTGHGLMAPNPEGPIPVNLFMAAGESTLADMIRSVRKGIYVTRFHYTNVVEPMKAVLTGMTRDGTFLIEGGEVTRPLKNLRFTESVLKALSRVSAIARERRVCSEGTVYSRRFVTGTVAPAVKIDGFNFTGVSSL